jgi:glycosyltransferase involved in cell wall biosynthesis
MIFPRVTVICLCYNHERFVREAINSVLHQSYKNIQLIVVDDASTDKSKEIIERMARENKDIELVLLKENQGNCKAFNRGLALAQGEFLIDFAADDVLLPNRIAVGIAHFENVSARYGVQFSDAAIIDEEGNPCGLHSERFTHTVPQGDIYKNLISTYFINGPSMMVRKKVFDMLGGYDETLAYEDFDFLIRSSREFNFFYVPEMLVKTRIVKGSMGQLQFKRSSAQLKSTFEVCKKILILNRTKEEQQHLAKRIRYEIRVCLRLLDFGLMMRYMQLSIENARLKYNT